MKKNVSNDNKVNKNNSLSRANKKTKSNKPMILIILIAIILAMGGYIVYVNYFSPNRNISINYDKQELEELIIKLADQDTETYMRVILVLSFDDRYKDLNDNMPIVKDTCISYFTSKTSNELSAGNLETVKVELVNALNLALGEDVINKVYFTDLVVQ